MPNDATEQHEQPALPLEQVALVAALARLISEEIAPPIQERLDAATPLLVKAYEENGQSGIVARVDGIVAGKYTVNTTKSKIVVDDSDAFDAYAATHGGHQAIIQRDPMWEKAVLGRAVYDAKTGHIVDEAGEIIPGLKYVSGGKATGNVTFTWADGGLGRDILMKAAQSGQLRHLMGDLPELTAGQPPAEQE
ncbi:hypothetical protein [Streptomyces subrutilus]|uniref:Uncharacterized protein n=1 Tax=Streptomyces subrutilus TaxID=36818 RepID=A0A1E5NXM2_9ACTN|nr:hypothetical protein [Streptomyces subrutilus]OEJ21009.1 hypothetical protein BGK67_34500 [Streptomyces subrutilus]